VTARSFGATRTGFSFIIQISRRIDWKSLLQCQHRAIRMRIIPTSGGQRHALFVQQQARQIQTPLKASDTLAIPFFVESFSAGPGIRWMRFR
jgi:hypothetical protein